MTTAAHSSPFDPIPDPAFPAGSITSDGVETGAVAIADMQPMVELRSVTKRFGNFTAVDNVSLSIEPGEFITLLGPSGCGKTTLLRMLSGFETPTSGRIILDNRDVTNDPPYKRDVNQVFQSYALFPHLSVEDNIAFGLRMKKVARGEIRTRVAEAVEMVNLQGMERRKPSQLSGGQRQRVALARAVVCRPRVLLLDEPLAALDAKLRHSMQLELKQLQDHLGITFVFVTHDQEEALTMSDRIAVINQGRIEQLGSAADIYHAPHTRFVATFIGQANILQAAVAARSKGKSTLKIGHEISLTVDVPDIPATAQQVSVAIRPEKIHLRKLTPNQPAEPGAFIARVTAEVFKGATAQLSLRTPGGQELTAVITNTTAARQRIARNDEVACSIHPDDVVVLNDGD